MEEPEIFKDIPERIKSSIKMEGANDSIRLVEGDFELILSGRLIPFNGIIEVKWLPIAAVSFWGTTDFNEIELAGLLERSKSVEVKLNEAIIGEAKITNRNFLRYRPKVVLRGRFVGQVIIGDLSIPVTKIAFSVPNLREFYGDLFKVKPTKPGKDYECHYGRLHIENDRFRITLDKSHRFTEIAADLHTKGGYVICYDGELIKKGSSITFKEGKEVLHCLGSLFIILNGLRTHPLFATGIHGEGPALWTNYTCYIVDSYVPVVSWPTIHENDGFNDLWQNFSNYWSDKDDREFLRNIIDWYSECISPSGIVEGSLIMAQTALELLYNWWVIEKLGIISGDDSKNISASNKIRLLLSQVGVNYTAPDDLVSLKMHIEDVNSKKGEKIVDGPDAVVQIRNAIIHSQLDKRQKLRDISDEIKIEALKLSIWYIELSLLKILEYNGKYNNRCSLSEFNEVFVPWVKEN